MNKNVYLKFPSINEKNEWIQYIKEYCLDNPKAKPLGCTTELNYEEWIKKISNESLGINLLVGRVPSTVYFLMNDNKILGHISIRHNINTEFLSKIGGHIGYGIRPSERKKGYATIMLNLALEKCKELGLEEVEITCKEENVASAKTIENNCGKLIEKVYIPEEQIQYKKYLINVDEALKLNHKK